jgi:hypothetical protein
VGAEISGVFRTGFETRIGKLSLMISQSGEDGSDTGVTDETFVTVEIVGLASEVTTPACELRTKLTAGLLDVRMPHLLTVI